MKKWLTISGLVLLILVSGFFVWVFISKDPGAPVGETLKNFLPFGSGDDFPSSVGGGGGFGGDGEGGGVDDGGVGEAPKEMLFRISDTPVAGFVVLTVGTSSAVVRYAERATGHIYDINLSTGEKKRLTNQTLPKIYEAYFRADGGAALFRSLKDDTDIVENLSLSISPPGPPKSATSSEEGFYSITSVALRGNLDSVAVGQGNSLIYSLDDSRSVVSSAFDGTNQKTLFSSQFSEWTIHPYTGSTLIYTKPGTGVPGYAYAINNSSGSLTKVLGPAVELTALPNQSGTRVLYSYRDGETMRLFLKNLLSGAESEIVSQTVAHKCVWSRTNGSVVYCGVPSRDIGREEFGSWFLGETSFLDRIWSFDADKELAQLLAEPIRVLGFDLDVIRPALSPKEDYFIFINKNDLSLWALKLEPLGE